MTPSIRASPSANRAAHAVVLRAEGKEPQALAAAGEALAAIGELAPTRVPIKKVAFPQALEAALALGERERAEQLLERSRRWPAGRLAPSIHAPVSGVAPAIANAVHHVTGHRIRDLPIRPEMLI